MSVERLLLVALLVVVIGAAAWLLVRWRRRQAPQGDEALTIAAWTVLEARPANPLAILADLSLEDAIDVRRYGDAVMRFQEREHRADVRVAGTVVSVATNVRELATEGSRLTFELTSSIRAGLARGTLRLVRDRHGKLLASVQNTRTGKITELLRGAPSGARLGALTATVYGLAHLVSAQDLATKLDAVAEKVDVLIAFRGIDQRARLEAAYARARELGVRPIDGAVMQELRTIRHDVRELRYVWRGEVMHTVDALRDARPVNGWNARLPGTKASHAAVRDGLHEAFGRVALMEFALRFEHLLAAASGDTEPFLSVFPDELRAWEELGDRFEAKAGTIAFEDLSARPYVEAVREVVGVYRTGLAVVQADLDDREPG